LEIENENSIHHNCRAVACKELQRRKKNNGTGTGIKPPKIRQQILKNMGKIIDRQEKELRKKLHVLKTQAGMHDDEYRCLLSSYGVESSVDLNAHQLIDVINFLEKQTNKSYAEMDTWRKRVIASIGGYLKGQGIDGNINMIKGIACRATGCRTFNSIPKQNLINVYYAFKNKQKVEENIEKIAMIEKVLEIVDKGAMA
jgi:hypothetical protein